MTRRIDSKPMQFVMHSYRFIHATMAVLFAVAALMLIVIAAYNGWVGFMSGLDRRSGQGVIEAVGLLAAAVVALQISATITEEEVLRGADISGPTRVRRFLSRFFVVVIVALAIEGLVGTFKAQHEAPENMPYAASIIVATGVLLAGWGIFVKLNRAAEELEPEMMAEVKDEDERLKDVT